MLFKDLEAAAPDGCTLTAVVCDHCHLGVYPDSDGTGVHCVDECQPAHEPRPRGVYTATRIVEATNERLRKVGLL